MKSHVLMHNGAPVGVYGSAEGAATALQALHRASGPLDGPPDASVVETTAYGLRKGGSHVGAVKAAPDAEGVAPERRSDPATSKPLRVTTGNLRGRIAKWLVDSGGYGGTASEIDKSLKAIPSSVSKRLGELEAQGWVVVTGTRKSVRSKSPVQVYVATERAREWVRMHRMNEVAPNPSVESGTMFG